MPDGTQRCVVTVRLKQEVLDPEGRAILATLQRLGYDKLKNVRIAKRYELEFEADSVELESGKKSCEAESGKKSCEAESGKKSCEAESGKKSCEAESGKKSCEAESGKKSCEAESGKKSCEAESGRKPPRAKREDLSDTVQRIATQLLANPVAEVYQIEAEP